MDINEQLAHKLGNIISGYRINPDDAGWLRGMMTTQRQLRSENERLKAERADPNGWYCGHCQRGVDASEVSYHEQHEACGRVITDDRPPAPQPAPDIDLEQGLRDLYRAYVRLLESGMDRITSLGGDCDPVDVMEQNDIDLRNVRALLALIDARKGE